MQAAAKESLQGCVRTHVIVTQKVLGTFASLDPDRCHLIRKPAGLPGRRRELLTAERELVLRLPG